MKPPKNYLTFSTKVISQALWKSFEVSRQLAARSFNWLQFITVSFHSVFSRQGRNDGTKKGAKRAVLEKRHFSTGETALLGSRSAISRYMRK